MIYCVALCGVVVFNLLLSFTVIMRSSHL